MKALLLLAAASIAFATPSVAQKQDEKAALVRIAERGRLLYEVDKAAFEASEYFLTRVPEATSWPVRGWVVERGAGAGAYTVTFYGAGPGGAPMAGPGGRVALFVARMKDGKPISGQAIDPAARPPLSAAQQALARAREAAMSHIYSKVKARSCSSVNLNMIVVPPERPGGTIDAYMLTPPDDYDMFPFGGHHLVRVAPDGSVAERREFANGCLNVHRRPPGAKTDPPGVTTAYLLGPLPHEIHVYFSLDREIPVLVQTEKPKRLWRVDQDRITRAKLK